MINKQIGDRIKKTRRELGLTQNDIAVAIGVAKSTISRYENGTIETLKMPIIQMIANTLKVNPNWLVYKSDIKEPMDHAYTGDISLRSVKLKRFRMLGKIACGQPVYANEEYETYIDASADIVADFCLTAKGDSMIGARIYDNDIVFIREQPIVNNGEIAAVRINDEVTLKRWYFYPSEKKLVLNPENPLYEPLVYIGEELDEIECIGKAVYATIRL